MKALFELICHKIVCFFHPQKNIFDSFVSCVLLLLLLSIYIYCLIYRNTSKTGPFAGSFKKKKNIIRLTMCFPEGIPLAMTDDSDLKIEGFSLFISVSFFLQKRGVSLISLVSKKFLATNNQFILVFIQYGRFC